MENKAGKVDPPSRIHSTTCSRNKLVSGYFPSDYLTYCYILYDSEFRQMMHLCFAVVCQAIP